MTLLEKCQATYSSGTMSSTTSSSENFIQKSKNGGDSLNQKKNKNENTENLNQKKVKNAETVCPKNPNKIFDFENENLAAQKCNKKRFSLESQFYGHRPFKDVVNPLKPSQKCHSLQVRKVIWRL